MEYGIWGMERSIWITLIYKVMDRITTRVKHQNSRISLIINKCFEAIERLGKNRFWGVFAAKLEKTTQTVALVATDQDQAIQGQQPATQVVVTGIEENDVASDCSEEYIEDSVEKTEEHADGGLKSTSHRIRRNTI